MKPKVLFIANKYGDGKKERGLADWENGLQISLQSTGLAIDDAFHFDEHYLETGKKGDEALLQKIRTNKPDVVVLVTNKMPGKAFDVPNFETLGLIANVLNIPTVAIWGDLEIPEQIKISKALLPYTIFNPATAASAAVRRINKSGKYEYFWVPRDPRIFNNPNKERDIDLGYIGSSRKNRHTHIEYLRKNGINVITGGGEKEEHLSTEQYVDRYQRSKISLSFSRAHSSHVVNARPFEVMLSGAMLLEQESFELMKFYTPYIDYVPYSTKKDMLIKAKYFLENDKEREKIARSGQRKTEELYSAKRFWEIVLDKALGTSLTQVYNFSYAIPEGSLRTLDPWTANKMKFLNWLCSNSVGFVLYKIFNWRYWQENFREIWHKIFFVPIGKLKPFIQKKMSDKTFDRILKIKRKIIKTH